MNKTSEAIKSANLIVIGRLVDASNATLQATLENTDPVMKVIYKPVLEEKPLWDFADGNLANREYAAYLLSELGDFNLVPTTVLREGPFGFGMVQEWIEIDEELDVVDFGQSNDPQLRKLALFDAIINNTDRKFGHLLVDHDGKLRGCDHGVCFHQENKLRTVLWQFAGEQFTAEEIELLNKVNKLDLDSSFAELLTSAEISALSGRIANLLAVRQFPFPSDEWPAIPWPPV
ncbi:putative phosphatidylinositol kinase [Candidatus Nanopelagicus limnes]|uniref:Putative phosphatidylinositol kinase n=1 Tax=Candidatus Nanopelagicus limnae TaxID=1884634 RepID=A0A249JXW4_9ACTN|nr:SCO1664 family protein [Candidatus Nanopelagicus limnes]ASY09367.1 putative phosphatidylinositol kinase [Candidatus Nanopelagicus limnes]